jgi:hypothetical protein
VEFERPDLLDQPIDLGCVAGSGPPRPLAVDELSDVAELALDLDPGVHRVETRLSFGFGLSQPGFWEILAGRVRPPIGKERHGDRFELSWS